MKKIIAAVTLVSAIVLSGAAMASVSSGEQVVLKKCGVLYKSC